MNELFSSNIFGSETLVKFCEVKHFLRKSKAQILKSSQRFRSKRASTEVRRSFFRGPSSLAPLLVAFRPAQRGCSYFGQPPAVIASSCAFPYSVKPHSFPVCVQLLCSVVFMAHQRISRMIPAGRVNQNNFEALFQEVCVHMPDGHGVSNEKNFLNKKDPSNSCCLAALYPALLHGGHPS